MDPKHLYFFAEIVRYGSLTRASERLGVVQPTLTRIVKLLEDQAGGPLLLRGRYGVTPTEIGERLAAAGNGIAQQMETANEAIDQWKSGIGSELRVGVGPMLAISIMPSLLDIYLNGRWPYTLKLITASAGRLVERLNAGELDVVLAPSRMNLHQEKLHQEIVLTDRMAIYAGAKSELFGRIRDVSSAELAAQPWIVIGARSNIHEAPTEIFTHLGLTGIVPRVQFTGDGAMCLALLQSTGVLVPLPEKLADECMSILPGHKLKLDAPMPTRNIAFWSTKANKDRPQILHFRKQVTFWLEALAKA